MTEKKHYAERDAEDLDARGGYYFRHVLAMTAEELHSKSDIAAELAFRDMVKDRLARFAEEQTGQVIKFKEALAASIALLESDPIKAQQLRDQIKPLKDLLNEDPYQ